MGKQGKPITRQSRRCPSPARRAAVRILAEVLICLGPMADSWSQIPPVAGIHIEPATSVEVGQEVFFHAMDTIDDESLVEARFEWDFGDGYGLKYGEPFYYSMDGGTSCTHFYMNPGVFTVTLTVTDIDGLQDTASEVMSVTGEVPMEGFALWHAPFHARIAQYVYAQIPESIRTDPTNSLEVSLTSDQGFSCVLLSRSSLDPEEVFRLDHSVLPAGDYVLVARILDVSGEPLSIIREKFSKLYSGIPDVGIDENNALRLDGEPYFPVTPFLLDPSRIPSWAPGGYINTLYAPGYYVEGHTLSTWTDYLNLGSDYGWMVMGPIHRWEGYGGTHFGRNSDVTKLADYVTATKDHSALAVWVWKDEPNLGGRDQYIPASVYRSWTYKSHQIDPQHPVGVNLYGYDYLPYYDDRVTTAAGYDFITNAIYFGGRNTCVYDIVGLDIYPLEYRNHVSLVNTERGLMDLYAEAVDNMISRNYGLLPAMSFIETQDVQASRGTPGPTASQLRMEIWLNVVHGVKGINWFHYFEPTPPENFAVMAEFLDQITRLTPVVLSAEPEGSVSDSANMRGERVDTMMRETEEDIYVFAVRVTEPETEWVEVPEPESITVDFEVLGAGDTTLEVFDEGRMLPVISGGFTDTFTRDAVHIYRIPRSAAEETPTPEAPTPTPSPTVTWASTPSPTVTPTVSPELTPEPTSTATAAATVTPSPTATPTDTPTVTVTLGPTESATPVPTETPVPTVTLTSTATPGILGDFNGDGSVDIEDLLSLVTALSLPEEDLGSNAGMAGMVDTQPSDDQHDLNGDGFCDQEDVFLFSTMWGFSRAPKP